MAAVVDDAHHLHCPSKISFTTFRVSAEAATNDIQQHMGISTTTNEHCRLFDFNLDTMVEGSPREGVLFLWAIVK